MPTDLPPPKQPSAVEKFALRLAGFGVQHGVNLAAVWLASWAVRYGYHRLLPVIPTWLAWIAVDHVLSVTSHTAGRFFTRGQAKTVAENFSGKKG